MIDFPHIPSHISYKELDFLLNKASKETQSSSQEIDLTASEKEKIETLLRHWSQVSKELLLALQEKDQIILQEKTPQQSMALGVLKAHLTMAIHAKLASEEETK